MSWSFRRHNRVAAFVAAACAAAVPAGAAQVYWTPSANLTAETDSNLDLDPTGGKWVEGYIAEAAALIGIATQESNTTIRPSVDYRNYPSDSADDRLETFLDLNSAYRGQRSRADVYFGFQRRDEFNAELNSALYNENAPVSPTSPETGRTVLGGTRTSLIFLPDYSFNVSQRFSSGVSAIYQRIDYSPNNTFDAVDFQFYQAKLYGRWDVTQRSDITLGAYGSRYEATHFNSTANSGGMSLSLDTSWTPLFTTSVTAVYQHTNINTDIPTPFKNSSNPWGATASAVYKKEISQFRIDAGRLITPSGGGGIYVNDRAQLQYSRNFTERLTLTGAAIVTRNRGLTSNVSGDDRTYERVLLDAKWKLTRTLYLQGGYQYMRQKYELDPSAADNNRIYLRFGYQGMDRQW